VLLAVEHSHEPSRAPSAATAFSVVLVLASPELLRQTFRLIPAGAELRATSERYFDLATALAREATLWQGHLIQLAYHLSFIVALGLFAAAATRRPAPGSRRRWVRDAALAAAMLAALQRGLMILADLWVFSGPFRWERSLRGGLRAALLSLFLVLLARFWSRTWFLPAALALYVASPTPKPWNSVDHHQPIAQSASANFAPQVASVTERFGLSIEQVRIWKEERCRGGAAGTGGSSVVVISSGCLSRRDLKALIAHEAAHVVLGHNEVVLRDHALRSLALAMLMALALEWSRRRGWFSSPFLLCALLFAVKIGGSSALEFGTDALRRARELEADASGAAVVGIDEMVEWLRGVPSDIGNDPFQSPPQEWAHSHPCALRRIEALERLR